MSGQSQPTATPAPAPSQSIEVTQEAGVNENVVDSNNNNGSQPTQAEGDTPQSGQTSQTQVGQIQSQRAQVKRKPMDSRSDVWNHFTKVYENEVIEDVIDSNGSNRKDSIEHMRNESDAANLGSLNNSLQDHVFSECFMLPPQKIIKPCQVTTTCHRMPIYIGGRYLKFSRKVSQSRWIIDDERMGEASVEEIVGSSALSCCKGDGYKFHAAGREDIDVRMLGSGRPFLVEVSNARCTPSMIDVQQIAETINNSDKRYVSVRNLKVVGSEVWALMRQGETEKQKQYSALVWTSRPLTEEDLDKISSMKNMEILQRMPIRVLHRRSPLERKRIIHWMKVEKITGSCQYFLLHLCTQAGTYIKEFVHGDLGRTHPSIGSILGCRAEILQLDVTDVKMDFFD